MLLRMMAGSVPGTDHTRPGFPIWTNNQDGYSFVNVRHEYCVGVVCDGCSGGLHSEVGAKLGSKFITNMVSSEIKQYNDIRPEFWSELKIKTTNYLLNAIDNSRSSYDLDTIENFLLFTIVGVAVTPQTTYIFNFGDGYYSINGDFFSCGPFPENKPPYIMYTVTGSPVLSNNPNLSQFQIIPIPTKSINTVSVGSDGVEDLLNKAVDDTPERLFLDKMNLSSFYNNPDNLRRHLALMNREHVVKSEFGNTTIGIGFLRDDTTIISVHLIHEEDNGTILESCPGDGQ